MNAQPAKQHAKVSKVRNLLSNMAARPAASPESEAWRAFHHHQSFQPIPLDTSPRGIAIRAINRISAAFSWGPQAITMFLDTKRVGNLADLTDPQLDDLHERMLAYEDSAMNGYGPPDGPVA